jgi:hypothetical protein
MAWLGIWGEDGDGERKEQTTKKMTKKTPPTLVWKRKNKKETLLTLIPQKEYCRTIHERSSSFSSDFPIKIGESKPEFQLLVKVRYNPIKSS